jgi:hypothetical protein
VQQTILVELYATLDLKTANLSEEAGVWAMYYNYRRVHGTLGKTPVERKHELSDITPYSYAVQPLFDPKEEALRMQKRLLAQLRRKVKGSP